MVLILKDEKSQREWLLGYQGPTHFQIYVQNNGVFKCYRHGFEPPCSCRECVQQFRTKNAQTDPPSAYTKALTENEARQMAHHFVQNIYRDQEYLQNQCEINGNAILKRWRKKSQEDRQALLLEIDPDMYPNEWSEVHFDYQFSVDYLALDEDSKDDPNVSPEKERRKHRGACLLPYINTDSLKSDPERLLRILFARTRYGPEKWAAYDSRVLKKNWICGGFELSYNGSSIIMHGDNYGRVVPWSKEDAHSWTNVGFPRAILVLEAQHRLLSLLRKIVDKLLEGRTRDTSAPQSENFFKLVEGNWRRTGSGAFEMASTYLNQPFCRPPLFDIEELQSIVQTRLRMHADHLLLLQTEPAYTRRHISLSLAGGFSENLMKQNQYKTAIHGIMYECTFYWLWEWTMEEIKNLEVLHKHFEADIRPGKHLPEQYEKAMGVLEALLVRHLRYRNENIHRILPLRPGFKNTWNAGYLEVSQSMAITSNKSGGTAYSSFFTDRLDFCLSMLEEEVHTGPDIEKEDFMLRHDHSILFGMLEEHLASNQGNRKELARLDEVLYMHYSDLSAIAQILALVKSHRPKARWLDLETAKGIGSGKAWRYINKYYLEQGGTRMVALSGTYGRQGYGNNVPNREKGQDIIAAEELLAGYMKTFLLTPPPQSHRYSQAWLDQDAQQRASLSKLWQGIRARHQQTLTRIGIDQQDVDDDLKFLSADSEQGYIDFLASEREAILAEIARKATKKPSNSSPGVTWNAEDPKEKQSTLAKIKVKTRGTTEDSALSLDSLAISSSSPTPSPSDQETIEEAPLPVAKVNKRALSVFRSMFPSRDAEDRSKTVDWDAFVNAMAEPDIGFIARGVGGSAVLFEPNETSLWAGKGKIVFHRPHPENFVGSVVLWGMGKRMSKWFGWSAESFALKK